MSFSKRAWRGTVFALGLVVAFARPVGASDGADETVRRCLELLRAAEIEAAEALFVPGSLPENASELLRQGHEALQLGDTVELEIVNRAFTRTTESGDIHRLVYHARGEERALLIIAQTREVEGAQALEVLRWEPTPLDLSQRYPFRLAGVPVLYYVVLGFAIAIPVFVLSVAVLCFRRKPPRRWLWLAFILLGIGKLSVIWVPGPLDLEYVGISPLAVQVLGAGLTKAPIYDPWVLSISLPLGALLFLLRRPRPPSAVPSP